MTRALYFAALLSASGRKHRQRNQSIGHQQELCGRGGRFGGRREGQGRCLYKCSCEDSIEHLGLNFTFVWQQRLHDPLLERILMGENDVLRVRVGDIVLLNAGLDDIADPKFRPTWQSEAEAQASRMAALAKRAWQAGRRVFWRSTSRICGDPVSSWRISLFTVNRLVSRSNGIVRQAMEREGVPYFDMDVITQAINQCADPTRDYGKRQNDCRCNGYADHIHPGPRLSDAQFRHLLGAISANDVCRTWPPRAASLAHGPGGLVGLGAVRRTAQYGYMLNTLNTCSVAPVSTAAWQRGVNPNCRPRSREYI